MSVYIEYVIFDNMVIDTLILLTCKKIATIQTTKLKLLLGALIGTIFALLNPLLTNIVNLLIKPFVAVLMVVIAFKPNSIKKLIIYVILLFFSTFLFGGATIGLMQMFNIDYSITSSLNYNCSLPMGIAVLICAITYIILKNIIVYCLKKQKHFNFLYSITLIDNNNTITISAFLDSGNCVVINNKPLTIINYKTFNMLYPKISITDLLLKKQLPIKNQNYAEIKGLSTTEKILTFEIQTLKINNKETQDALIGLSLTDFNNKTNSDAIISNMILGD